MTLLSYVAFSSFLHLNFVEPVTFLIKEAVLHSVCLPGKCQIWAVSKKWPEKIVINNFTSRSSITSEYPSDYAWINSARCGSARALDSNVLQDLIGLTWWLERYYLLVGDLAQSVTPETAFLDVSQLSKNIRWSTISIRISSCYK